MSGPIEYMQALCNESLVRVCACMKEIIFAHTILSVCFNPYKIYVRSQCECVSPIATNAFTRSAFLHPERCIFTTKCSNRHGLTKPLFGPQAIVCFDVTAQSARTKPAHNAWMARSSTMCFSCYHRPELYIWAEKLYVSLGFDKQATNA